MNKLTHYLQPRDWWPRAYFWMLMIVAVVIGCAEYSELESQHAQTYTWEVQQVRIDSCEYIIGWGQNKFGVYAITHKANCDNHGSNNE